MEQETPVELDRKDLKIQALKERLAEITVQYEERDVDRRIDITMLSQQVQELQTEIQRLNTPDEEPVSETEE